MIDFIAHHAGSIGLVIFFGFFTATACWVYRPNSKESYIAKANIPLKEDTYE
ncbi:MAG: CcoQ/FixQ family Cbb3-type cytochrome c oxidase assembly chaperone [Alphaproteobacteria bacterium]|nr:CcoQ/FixQ family Cbb3-type cytochrome c oxidase assembly chaperone [Alphaproteobacteria bacterium]